MRFAFVTDEIHDDPKVAIETALDWGITDFEIRNIWGKRFPRVSLSEMDTLLAMKEEYGIHYTALSPGFFKESLRKQDALEYVWKEGTQKTFDFARQAEIPLVICFSFQKNCGTRQEVVELLKRMGMRAEASNIRIAVENEREHWCDMPPAICTILKEINLANVGLNWDPGNMKQDASQAFPQGYEQVKPFIFNVHVKDVVLLESGETQWSPLGTGLCDWQGQMKALLKDGVVDSVTIESHCGPRVEVGKHNLSYLRTLVEQASKS